VCQRAQGAERNDPGGNQLGTLPYEALGEVGQKSFIKNVTFLIFSSGINPRQFFIEDVKVKTYVDNT
jgi:hypothetical protein